MENSPYSAVNIVRHFWSRRLVLLLLIPLFFVGSVMLVRSIFVEIFESTAMIRVRTPASSLRTGPSLDVLSPPVYKRMLLNDGLLHEVITKAREKFPEFPRGNFEGLRSGFDLEVIMTRDTAIVAEFSPVLVLSVRSNTAEQAHFLASTWLELATQRFGNMRHLEAVEIQKTYQKQFEVLSAKVEQLQLEEGTLQQDIARAANRLAVNNRLLGAAPASSLSLSPDAASQESPKSLLEEKVDLELDIAELEAGARSPENREELSRLNARLSKVNELVTTLMEGTDELGAERARKSQRLDAVREELLGAREQLADIREIVVNMTPETTLLKDPFDGGVEGAFSVIARPVKPETRVGPPRAIYAVVIALALSAILVVVLLLEFYLKAAIVDESRR